MPVKGVYKRGKVYWIRYAGIDGRTVFESSGSDKFRDAEALLIERKQMVKDGKNPGARRIGNDTFRDLADQYLQWIDGRQRAAGTKACRIKGILTRFGNLPLKNFTTFVVEQYQTELIDRGFENATVNHYVGLIKHMIRKAVEWDMAADETLKRVRKVKMLPVNNRRLRYLSEDECQALIKACDAHLRPIVIMALNTGMRRGEILNLKWDQVDLIHGFILLSDRDTKNMERREIPINGTLKETFLSLSGGKLTRRIDVPYVFYDPKTGKPYGSTKKSFTTACRRAGIRDFHFHDLRHTFASHLVMRGIDLVTVKELLGHKSLTMTLRYSHLAPSHKASAVNVLDGAFSDNEHYADINNGACTKKDTIQKLYKLQESKNHKSCNGL